MDILLRYVKMRHDDIVIRKVVGELKKMKGKYNLLDIGCAEEYLKELLPRRFEYNSLDYFGNHTYVRDLNYPLHIEERFDIIVCLETLEHTLKPHEVMREVLKLGKKDTIFFFSMPNEYNFYSRLNFLIGRKFTTQEPFMLVEKFLHIHLPRVKDIENFFNDYLDIDKIDYVWYSRSSEHGKSKPLFRTMDAILNLLSKRFHSLFSRSVLIKGRLK